jgi:hypothetical protein
MQFSKWLKISLAIAFIGIGLYFLFIDYSVDKELEKQYHALSHLKNDPLKDSATNRILYAERKAAINKQINLLEKKRHPYWYRTISVILMPVSGGLIRNALFKKRAA